MQVHISINKKILPLAFILFVFPFFIPLNNFFGNIQTLSHQTSKMEKFHSKDTKIKTQGSVIDYYNKQWLENPTFDLPIEPWFNTILGDNSDVNASASSGEANFEILGQKGSYSIIAEPPSASNWNETENPDFPNKPDECNITSEGCRVSHKFRDDTAIQNPCVHWDQNISLSINISDYIITSASVKSIINATVDTNLDRYEDYIEGRDARAMPSREIDTYGVGDYIRFYVLISDLAKNKIYEIAYFQTENLGNGSAEYPPVLDYLSDYNMTSVPEEDLIYYLSSVLSTDGCNFTISLGIRIHIEDNLADYYDIDTFNELMIKYLNLTFNYEKKIDQFTSISWIQVGDKIIGENVDILDATLNFKYKIDHNWTQFSPNSEIRILINNITYIETIKLSSANLSFQEAKNGGFNVTSLILDNVNITISIQVFLADEFRLDKQITISIDDIFLEISYKITTQEHITSYTLLINSEDKTSGSSIEILSGESLNITFKYEFDNGTFIPNATVLLNGISNDIIVLNTTLTENSDKKEYNLIVNSSIITKSFKEGDNFLTLTASKKYFETQIHTITLIILEYTTSYILLINSEDKTSGSSIEIFSGESLNITFKYEFNNGTFIPNATVLLNGISNDIIVLNTTLTENSDKKEYNIIVNSSTITKSFKEGDNFLTLTASKKYFETQIHTITLIIIEYTTSYTLHLNMEDKTSGSSIEILSGESLNITFKYEFNNGIFISNATVLLYGISNDIIVLNATLTENSDKKEYNIIINNSVIRKLFKKGDNFLTLTASKKHYETQIHTITLIITEKENSFLWIILLFSFIIIGVMTALSVRTYYILPRKRKKESGLLFRTQNFKDIRNIQAVLINNKNSGLPLFIKSYSILKEENKTLFSGFIQAITLMGERITEKSLETKKINSGSKKTNEVNLLSLDFRYFHSLICDKKDLRLVLILSEKASERLKTQTNLLISKLSTNLSETMANWDGELDTFQYSIPPILNEYLGLYYKDPFILNDKINFLNVLKERNLSKMEIRLINVIHSVQKESKTYKLENLIEMIDEENEDLIIEAIESLIAKKFIIPIDSKDLL